MAAPTSSALSFKKTLANTEPSTHGTKLPGPDVQTDGVVRWRRVDLQAVIEDRFVSLYDWYVTDSQTLDFEVG